jgi:hypothetical protein
MKDELKKGFYDIHQAILEIEDFSGAILTGVILDRPYIILISMQLKS